MATPRSNGKSTEADISDLTDQIETLRDDVSKLTELMGEYATSKGKDLKSQAADATDRARETASDASDRARETALDAAADASELARRNPGAALGLAAGVGFLVGYLARPRG